MKERGWGEGEGMTKSVTCLFNFSVPPPSYIPWGHGLQRELQIFTNSINRIQIVFRGASTTQAHVRPPAHRPQHNPPTPAQPHALYRRVFLPASPIFPKFKMS